MTTNALVVMGVSGCGKSSLAVSVAQAMGWRFVEGDDHHPLSNRTKMQSGLALTDDDREGWLQALAAILREDSQTVLACSALKQQYREILAPAGGIRWVYVNISPDLALQRVAGRGSGHFFPSTLVHSQFEALQPPVPGPDVLQVEAEWAPEVQLQAVLHWLRTHPSPAAVTDPGLDPNGLTSA